MIYAEQAEFCLVGGVDFYLQWDTLEWLDVERQLMSEQNRSGLYLAKAPVFVWLHPRKAARRRGLDVLAWLVGAATARERNLIKTNDICIGEGLSEAITEATAAPEAARRTGRRELL